VAEPFEIDAVIANDLLAGTFPGNLGIELLEVADRSVRARLVVDERHLHGGGYVHGGCWVAFADTVAAWGTMRLLGGNAGFTTGELKMNVFTAAVPGDELVGTGEALHVGGRTQVWEVRVHRLRDGVERLAANFTCTQHILS
jgi:uncharacterized protein (TIGR00369 family)